MASDSSLLVHVYILNSPFFYYNHHSLDCFTFLISQLHLFLLIYDLSLSLGPLSFGASKSFALVGSYDLKVRLSYVVPYFIGL